MLAFHGHGGFCDLIHVIASSFPARAAYTLVLAVHVHGGTCARNHFSMGRSPFPAALWAVW